MSNFITLPVLLISNSSSGKLLDFLNPLAPQLRHTTSLRTALSVLENYQAKIIVSDLPVEENEKLVSLTKTKNILTIILAPSTTSIQEISKIQDAIWLQSPFKNEELKSALANAQSRILYIRGLKTIPI